MIDRRGLDQRLALARLGFSPPAAAKVRVRDGIAGPGASRAAASVFAGPRVALLMGLSLALGYGLGRQGGGPRAEPAAEAGVASRAEAGVASRAEAGVASRAEAGVASRAEAGVSVPAPRPPESPPIAAPSRRGGSDGSATPPSTSAPPASAAISSALDARRAAPSAGEPRPARADAPRSSRARHADASGTAVRARRDELALLRRVERALRAKEAALALALLDELDRRHPRTALHEERTAARVVAECVAASPRARSGAERFLAEQGRSVYVDRVLRACELQSSPEREGSRAPGH